MSEDTKNKGGRPSFEITEEVCERAKSLAAQGLTQEQIAVSLGLGERTFYEKKEGFPQFSHAIEQGQAIGIQVATNALFTKVKEEDLGAIKYYLNNRDNDNWKDRQTSEITGDLGLHETFLDALK